MGYSGAGLSLCLSCWTCSTVSDIIKYSLGHKAGETASTVQLLSTHLSSGSAMLQSLLHVWHILGECPNHWEASSLIPAPSAVLCAVKDTQSTPISLGHKGEIGRVMPRLRILLGASVWQRHWEARRTEDWGSCAHAQLPKLGTLI